MILPNDTVPFVTTLVSVVAGTAVGLIYFAALRRSVTALVDNGGWLTPAILTIVRLVGIAIVFGFAAKLGAMPLLAAFIGFLIARAISLRWTPRAS